MTWASCPFKISVQSWHLDSAKYYLITGDKYQLTTSVKKKKRFSWKRKAMHHLQNCRMREIFISDQNKYSSMSSSSCPSYPISLRDEFEWPLKNTSVTCREIVITTLIILHRSVLQQKLKAFLACVNIQDSTKMQVTETLFF